VNTHSTSSEEHERPLATEPPPFLEAKRRRVKLVKLWRLVRVSEQRFSKHRRFSALPEREAAFA
jgi:hypothetical protein